MPNKVRERSKSPKHKPTSVYGEFIRTFTFNPGLPIVQPGASFVFPNPTVPPSGVQYIEKADQVGLKVPRGTYLVSWTLNPNEGASVSLLVNGIAPTSLGTPAFSYTQAIITSSLSNQYLVKAPLKKNNLISLVNSGTSLLTLNAIANTTIGPTSIITHIRVQRIDKH